MFIISFCSPNVTLVDTDGAGVERITEKGVVANGKEYEVDCIIYGTGFEVGSSYTHRAGYELYGRGGLSLSEKWKDGAATLHGMAVHGFPNYFFVQGMQTAFVYNNNHINRVLVEHIAYIINEATKRGVKSVEVTPEAEAAWTDTIVKTAALRESFYRECE